MSLTFYHWSSANISYSLLRELIEVESGTIIENRLASKMKRHLCLFIHLVLFESVFGATIVKSLINKGENVEGDCTLPPKLLAEIQSYQPVVDKIVSAAVNGPFSGSTWKR